MTLTVRLDQAIEAALARYCAERGVTKSLVVQQSLAAYLTHSTVEVESSRSARNSASPLFEAFQNAGLVGSGILAGVAVTKDVVRLRAQERASNRGRKE